MSKKTNRIDVHHHITPKEYVEQLKSIGIAESFGIPFPDWTPETSLKFMKKVGIDTAMMSVTSPGVSFKDNKEFSLQIARWTNDYMAKLNHYRLQGGRLRSGGLTAA